MSTVTAAILRGSSTHVVPGKLKVTELSFSVPVDYSDPSRGELQIFARSVGKHETPAAMLQQPAKPKPWLIYLQGGPGIGCQTPQASPITVPVLDRGYQMLYIDQRGTGLSSTITAATLAERGNAQEQADHLKFFRADNIVRDCEAIRKTLTTGYPPELQKWSIFGQSFGGFCALNYLSNFPDGLRELFLTGGFPPIGVSAEGVYEATFAQVINRNQSYYNKFPEDIERIRDLVTFIGSTEEIPLPSGGKLTCQRFLAIGFLFGGHGGTDMVHDIVLRMSHDRRHTGFFTRPTLAAFESLLNFDDNIIFALLHEPVYCEQRASGWAAERVSRTLGQFQWVSDPTLKSQDDRIPFHFTGEMIFPFLFDVYPELSQVREVADILASYQDWPELYNEAQLAVNEVPIFSICYVDDMYVDFGLAQEAVKKVKGVKQYITNSLYHNAMRVKTDEVMKKLFELRDDVLD